MTDKATNELSEDVKSECIDKIIKLCHSNLFAPDGEQVLNYLMNKRGLTEATIREFKLGCFPRYADVAATRGGSYTAWKCGVVGFKPDGKVVSKFTTHKIIIPIYSEQGVPIAIMGRSMHTEESLKKLGLPKYTNSFYKKTSNLYGLNLAREAARGSDSIVLVEGNLDVITAFQHGIRNVSATSKAHLHRKQFLLASRYASNIYLCLDNDEAGKKGTQQALETYKEVKGTNLHILDLPSRFKDIDDCLQEGYGETIKQQLRTG